MRSTADHKGPRRPTWATWATVALVLASAGPVVAIDWDGSESASWDDPLNWSTGTLPTAATGVVFPTPVPGTGPTITLGTGEQAASLTFNDSYTLTGGDLTVTSSLAVASGKTAEIASSLAITTTYPQYTGNGTLILSGDNSASTRPLDVRSGSTLILAGDNAMLGTGSERYIHVYAGGKLAVQGSVTITSSSSRPIGYLRGTATDDTPMFESISGDNVLTGAHGLYFYIEPGDKNIAVDAGTLTVSKIEGTGNLVKLGPGTLITGGNWTYNGETKIKNGTLELTGGTLPSGTLVTLGSATTGGVLDLKGQSQTIGGLTTAGSAASDRVVNSGAAAAALTISIPSAATTYSFDGILGGAGQNDFSLTKAGSGTQILTGANTYTGGTTISGGTLQLSGGNDRLSTGGTITVTGGVFDLGGNTQNVSAAVTFQGGTVQNGTLNKSGADFDGQTGTVSATLDGGVGLTKTGGGTLILSGPNTYTGTTSVTAGVLNIQNDAALGSNVAGTTVASGAQLQLQGDIAVSGESLAINGGTALRNISGDNTWAGPVAVNAYSYISVDSGSLNIGGAMTGGNRINKVGAGTLILSGDNSAYGGAYMDVIGGVVSLRSDNAPIGGYFHVTNAGAAVELQGNITTPGGKTIYLTGVPTTDDPSLRGVSGDNAWGGNLVLHGGGPGDRNVGVDAGSTLTILGTISQSTSGGSGPRNLVKVGDGTLILRGSASYTGTANVKQGVLNIQHGSALGSAVAGTIVASGAELQLQNNITVAGESLALNGGTALRSVSGNNTWTGPIQVNASSDVAVDADSLTISGNISGARLDKEGAGTLFLSGDNSGSTDHMDINGGAVRLQNGLSVIGGYFHVYNASAALELEGNITTPAGKIVYLSGTATNDDPALRGVSGNNTWGGNVVLHNGGGDHNIGVDGGSSLTINGSVGQTTPGNLVKVGGGTLVLRGAGSYTGTTNVKAGVLNIQNDDALGSTAAGTTVASGAQLQLQGGITIAGESLTLNGGTGLRNISGDNAWAGSVNVASHSVVSVDSGSLEVSGNISGARFDKTGAGTLILSGDNSGTTAWMDVNGGVVSLRSNNAPIGSYFHVTNAAAVVELQGNITTPGGKTVYLTGVPTTDDPSLRGVSGDNAWGGNLVLHGGGPGDRNVGVNAGSTLTIQGTISQSTSGGSGPRNLVKVGDGTLVLEGNGTYTGTTDVKQGTLWVNGTLNSTAMVTVYDGAWLGGNGSIAGSVDVLADGGVSAGNSPGHLTIGGQYTQAGTMLAELGGTDQGVNYDWIEVGGIAQVDGIVDILLVDGFQPAAGNTFDVLTAAGGVEDLGIQLDWDPAQLAPAEFWTYQIVPFGSGEALQLQLGVPEPSSLVLAALALLTLVPFARRRRKTP